jgi:hypothetical protein
LFPSTPGPVSLNDIRRELIHAIYVSHNRLVDIARNDLVGKPLHSKTYPQPINTTNEEQRTDDGNPYRPPLAG